MRKLVSILRYVNICSLPLTCVFFKNLFSKMCIFPMRHGLVWILRCVNICSLDLVPSCLPKPLTPAHISRWLPWVGREKGVECDKKLASIEAMQVRNSAEWVTWRSNMPILIYARKYFWVAIGNVWCCLVGWRQYLLLPESIFWASIGSGGNCWIAWQ